jgi:ATP-binding cassette subfamily B protein
MSNNRAQPDGIISLCKWALGFSMRRWSGLTSVLVAMLLKTALDVLAPWPMKILVDNVMGHRPFTPLLARYFGMFAPQTLVTICVGATVLLFLSAWAVGVLAALANIAFGQRMIYDLASDLFGHLQRMSLRYHARSSTGDLIRRVTTDCGAVSTIVKDALLPVVASVFSLIAMFCIMWRIDW